MTAQGRVPQIIAHRGASAYAPENTPAAFDLALEMGAPAIETDVRATRDGHLLLLHDERVDRTTDGHGRLADLTFDEARRLDAGSWLDPRFAGQRIPTLGEFLARYATRVPVCLEIKAPDIEASVLEGVARTSGVVDVTYTSFSIESVARVRELSPTARTGYLARDFGQASVEMTLRAGANQICPPAKDLEPELIESARRLGLEVRAWGVPSDFLLERAIALGVDGLTTNWPDRGLALVRTRYGVDRA